MPFIIAYFLIISYISPLVLAWPLFLKFYAKVVNLQHRIIKIMKNLRPFSDYLMSKLIDWLIILFIAALILWAAFTLPVFSSKTLNTDLSKDTEARLKSTVSTLVNTYNPRTYRYETLDFTTDFLRSELAQFGTVEVQAFGDIENGEKIYKNLILRLGPHTKESGSQ